MAGCRPACRTLVVSILGVSPGQREGGRAGGGRSQKAVWLLQRPQMLHGSLETGMTLQNGSKVRQVPMTLNIPLCPVSAPRSPRFGLPVECFFKCMDSWGEKSPQGWFPCYCAPRCPWLPSGFTETLQEL